MKNRILAFRILLYIIMGFIAISGCAASRISLADKGLVSVETVPSKKVEILWTDVYEDGNDIVFYGVFRRISHSRSPLKSHVDVTVFSPDGNVLYEDRTPQMYVPLRIVGKGINWRRFKVHFPGQIPKGSLMRAVCHAEPHDDEKECQD